MTALDALFAPKPLFPLVAYYLLSILAFSGLLAVRYYVSRTNGLAPNMLFIFLVLLCGSAQMALFQGGQAFTQAVLHLPFPLDSYPAIRWGGLFFGGLSVMAFLPPGKRRCR